MVEHKSIEAALAAFQGEMPTVAKAKRAEVPTKAGGKYTYTYADLAAVTEAAMPILAKHGLSFTAVPRNTGQGYVLKGVLLHTNGGRIKGELPIRGGTPQEIGSALTYMRRYLLGCLTGVVTDDDDDGSPAGRTSRPKPAAAARKGGITQAQSQAMHASFNDAGIVHREARIDYCRNLIGREIESSSDLTAVEASRVIDALKQDTEPQGSQS